MNFFKSVLLIPPMGLISALLLKVKNRVERIIGGTNQKSSHIW
jgi:hypothetical protein